MLFIVVNGFAQVTLSVKKQTIKQIIPQLEKASGYSVFYTNEMPDLNLQKDLNLSNTTINDALNKLLQGTDISYEIKADKQVLLFLKSQGNNQSPSDRKKTVTGRIIDENGEPLIGVSVRVKGVNIGTVTDLDGNYQIEVPEKSVLVVSYIGSVTQEINVANKSSVNITLQEDTHGLEEVVVIGYGTVKKKDLTGAVGAIKGDDLAVKKTTTLSSALQGSVAGLMVRRESSAPGASAGSMHIRGVTTIGDSSPLVIIDGVPGDIDHVNPNDVESISVLKDAASAAIYGSRAAAGVILVTTKRANQTDLNLTYTGEFGLEIPAKQPQMVGVTRYLEMVNELGYNDNPAGGFFPTYSADQVKNWVKYNQTDPNNYPITDWTDLILKSSAPRQTHSVHISGGNKTVRTKASLTYDDVDGLYSDRYFQRYMLRVNNDFTINKMLGATLDFSVRRAKNHRPIYSPFSTMRLTPAIYPATWEDGRLASGKSGGNPYGLMEMGGSVDAWSTQIGGKASIDFKPFEGFTLSGIVAPYINYTKEKEFQQKAFYNSADDPDVFGGWFEDGGKSYSTTKLSEKRNDDYRVTSQVIANYMKTINGHSITLMGGFENFYQKWEELGAYRDQYTLDQYPYLNVGPEEFWGNNGTGTEYTYNSFFGRVIYNYDNKYLFQANVRRDGSSRFSEKYRWGTFPSFSAGWVASEEPFIKNAGIDWLSFLKLRASWGSLGNERIGSSYFPYMALMTFGNTMFYQDKIIISDKTASQRVLAVADISWEKTQSTDIGIDLAFLNNRLRVTADYYWKQTKDMLLETKIPKFMGYNDPMTNAGKMSTKGFDLEIGWNDRKGDWSYGISANLSDFISTVDYMQNTKIIKDNKIKVDGVGFNEWYGYICEGIYQTQDQVDNSARLNDEVMVGDLWYRDISGPDGVPDGIISQEYDMVPLGNSLPRFQYGGNINVGYKGFDLSVSFQGIGKQNVRLERAMVEPLRSNYGNIPAIIDGKYWSLFNTDEENAKAIYPRLTHANRDSNYVMSDFWIFNGRYFRLKNLTLGYTLPKILTQKISINKIRVYASASDLFCISKYPSGWDPEMGVKAYPITTSLVFGLSVNF
ncbi:TonB-dependent receptor [Dysgonomonas sp. 511]|uniref:TonB-dependent receptor n=1 Tax=Dysgonomonas sp. 511 TaxID=2302930 RepID=UPI002105E704|nr:TonB-dependent receptor [Dysgonomonas sp. 511]